MKQSEAKVVEIDVDLIKVFISRARKKGEFKRMKEAIKSTGMVPIQVRDISDWPAKDRQRPSGGLYRYELIVGEGRLTAAKELKWSKIPAFIIDAPEEAIVGRFLAENMIRKALPWAQQARLVKADLAAGMSEEEVARRYKVTLRHVEKYRRILSKAATAIEDEIAAMPMNEAEVLTTLPEHDQTLVVAALRDEGALEGNVAAAAAKARAIREETGSLSMTSLKASLRASEQKLESIQKQLKPKRLHQALGPGNIETLLKDPEFKAALQRAKVSTDYFESLL